MDDFSEFEDTLSFVLNAVRVVGMALISVYLAVGLAAGPIGHIRGYRDPRVQLATIVNRRSGIGIEIAGIQQLRNVMGICLFL